MKTSTAATATANDVLTTHPPAVEAESLEFEYRIGNVRTPILRGLGLRIVAGEFIALAGPSGCGKTTLLNLIGGMERMQKGRIRVAGTDLGALDSKGLEAHRRHNVAFIFQFFNLLPNLTAMENVAAGLEVLGLPRARIRTLASEHLAQVGLDAKRDHFPSQLSGGEQQRVAIARALAKGSRLILADEPTGNLDSENAHSIMALLARIHAASRPTILLITHDPDVAARCGRTLRIRNGILED